MRITAAWVAAVVVVLIAACGEQADVTAIGRNSGPLPWETGLPTATVSSSPTASATSDDEASATPTPDPTPTSEPTETPEPTDTPEPTETSAPPTTTPTPEPTPEPEDPRARAAQLEAAVVALTNAERDDEGCGPLRVDDRLHAAALAHSEDMAARGYFQHESPEGEAPRDRVKAQGYDGFVAENIAKGQRTAEAVVAGWMDSSGHRRNILSCPPDLTGVGVAESDGGVLYWTQVFGRS